MNKQQQYILSLAHTGKINEALKACNKLLKKKPQDCITLLIAASIHAQEKNFSKVVECCRHCLKHDPLNQAALYNLGVAHLNLNDYENAAHAFIELEQSGLANSASLSNLGLCLWNMGKPEEAVAKCKDAVTLDPSNAQAWNNMGLAQKSLEDMESARKCFEQAIINNPHLSEPHYNLALILLADNDEVKAIEYLAKATKLNPEYTDAINQMAAIALKNNDTASAISQLKYCLEIEPNHIEALNNLGNAYMAERSAELAVPIFRKAIEVSPCFAAAYNNLGNALLELDDYKLHFDEAEKLYLKAIELAPKQYDTYKNLAVCYHGDGQHEKALEYFDIYLKHNPDDRVSLATKAYISEHQGEFQKGLSYIDHYIEESPITPEIAIAYGKLARHLGLENRAITLLKSLDDNSLSKRNKLEKYFILGKLYETLNDPDETFAHYKTANDLDDEKFDMSAAKRMFSNITSFFTRKAIKELNRSHNESALPIFIVGMPRSGTSLAEQILASHPEVYGAGELESIHHLTNRISTELQPKNNYPFSIKNMSVDFATRLATDYLDQLQKLSPKSTRIVDKMPHNFQALGLINLLFPKATIIHCKRSSIDVCLSIYFQHFNKHHAYANSLEDLGNYYNLYADMMEHWKSSLDIEIIDLQYERVIDDPETEIRNLIEKCGLPWHENCLSFHKTRRTVLTPSYDQVRRPLYKSSVAKWKKYENHISPLIMHLGERAY